MRLRACCYKNVLSCNAKKSLREEWVKKFKKKLMNAKKGKHAQECEKNVANKMINDSKL